MIRESKVPFLGLFNRTADEDPLKVYAWQIEIDGFSRFGFSKCTGLKAQTSEIKYREGGWNSTPRKSPGQTEFPDLTLERGQILAAGYGHLDAVQWYKQVYDAGVKKLGASAAFRRDIDLVQFDREGNEALRWRVVEAWPKDHDATGDFEALGSADSIERFVVCHEGYRLQTK